MAERVLSMHEVAGSIPAFSSMDEVALIAQLGERQTEDNVSRILFLNFYLDKECAADRGRDLVDKSPICFRAGVCVVLSV